MVMNGVVVLNYVGDPVTVVSWQRAMTMIHNGLAEVKEYVEGRMISSPSAQFKFPKVIKLLKRVYVEYRTRTPACSKKGVLKRDKWKCVYCDRAANTVDHIIPRAKGGLSTWENLAACCQPCNNGKGDKSVEEAGLRLQWIPEAPTVESPLMV
jgi:5-methylcytosine-specific restriction endonuclease McrA